MNLNNFYILFWCFRFPIARRFVPGVLKEGVRYLALGLWLVLILGLGVNVRGSVRARVRVKVRPALWVLKG